MSWVASCLCFIGFLHSAEMTMPSKKTMTQQSTSVLGKLRRLDSHKCPVMLQVVIKYFNTDPFRLGVTLYIGVTNTELFPVAAIIDYVLARGSRKGLLVRVYCSHGRIATF